MKDRPETTTAVTRIVLWPTRGDAGFTSTPIENPLADANPDEARYFAANYADVPLLELWRRLRLAEWNAAEYQRQLDAHVQGARHTRSHDEQLLAAVRRLLTHRRKTPRMDDLRVALGLHPEAR
jgi:hypothetical protein